MKQFTGLIKDVGKLSKEGVEAYFERKITLYGNGAKVSCPKEFEGQKAMVVILKDEE